MPLCRAVLAALEIQGIFRGLDRKQLLATKRNPSTQQEFRAIMGNYQLTDCFLVAE